MKSYGTGGVAGTGQRSIALKKGLLGYMWEGGRGIVCSVEGHKQQQGETRTNNK